MNSKGARLQPPVSCPRRFAWVSLAAIALGGCATRESVLQITSYRDPYFPEQFRVVFDQCAYRVDPGGDYQIAARTTRAPGPEGGGPIVQLLHVQIFWKPVPGKTHDDATGVDAVLRYVVASDAGASVFSGTGFVFPTRDWRKQFVAEIESGRLQLVAKVGDPPEVLGDARVSGKLLLEENGGRTVEILRELERRSVAK